MAARARARDCSRLLAAAELRVGLDAAGQRSESRARLGVVAVLTGRGDLIREGGGDGGAAVGRVAVEVVPVVRWRSAALSGRRELSC